MFRIPLEPTPYADAVFHPSTISPEVNQLLSDAADAGATALVAALAPVGAAPGATVEAVLEGHYESDGETEVREVVVTVRLSTPTAVSAPAEPAVTTETGA